MSPRHRRALLLVVFAAGCSVWRPLPGAGLAKPLSESLDEVRVVLRDGTSLDLDDVAFTPDSIVGLAHMTSARVAVARNDIVDVEAQDTDPFLAFLSGAGTVVMIILLIVNATPRT